MSRYLRDISGKISGSDTSSKISESDISGKISERY